MNCGNELNCGKYLKRSEPIKDKESYCTGTIYVKDDKLCNSSEEEQCGFLIGLNAQVKMAEAMMKSVEERR